MARWTSKD